MGSEIEQISRKLQHAVNDRHGAVDSDDADPTLTRGIPFIGDMIAIAVLDQAIENLLKKGPLKTRGLAARIDSDRLGLISYDT